MVAFFSKDSKNMTYNAQRTKRALMQFEDNAGPDQGLRRPLTESVDTVVHVDEQRLLRSDCTDVHADLDLRCPQMVHEFNLFFFSCVTHHMYPFP